MVANECIPFYDDGDDITGVVTTAVTGKRCVKVSGDLGTAGCVAIAPADAGGRIFGVAGLDGAVGDFVRVLRGTKSVVPIRASAAIAAFEEVMVGANGTVVPAVSATEAESAELVTGVVGDDNAIHWTSRIPGSNGNDISVAIVVAGNNTALSVAVAAGVITVNSATDGAGAATSTADQVKTAVEADPEADALVTVADEGASDGSGVVAAVAATPLAGGTDEDDLPNKIGYAITAAADATDAQISLY